MTDRAGRIVLKPGFANGLVILRLVAGNAEPMTEFPVMPGESSEEREIPFDPKPLTVSYQVQLDAIRDEVVDLVALRARLEKRMEARLQGEDLAGVEEGLKEYALLPPREQFADAAHEAQGRGGPAAGRRQDSPCSPRTSRPSSTSSRRSSTATSTTRPSRAIPRPWTGSGPSEREAAKAKEKGDRQAKGPGRRRGSGPASCTRTPHRAGQDRGAATSREAPRQPSPRPRRSPNRDEAPF